MMEFIIDRTSGGSKKPCNSAYQKTKGQYWFINIEGIGDLLEILQEAKDKSKNCTGLIIDMQGHGNTIEIYDAWREPIERD